MGAVVATTFRFGPYRLTPVERLLERDGCPVVVGSRALDLLIILVERAGEVVSRRELMDRVWPGLTVEDTNLRVHVAGLRKLLGEGVDGARFIANLPGRGYCFVAPVEVVAPVERPQVASSQVASSQVAPPQVALPQIALPQIAPEPVPIGAARAMSPPPPLSRMVGRDQTVAALAALLLERRFVSVVGPGGMGKTTVATAVAHRLADSFDGQVAFVDLATHSDAGLLIATVSTAIGATLTQADPLAGLLAFVAERRMLVVLDNCEHLADAVAALAEHLHTRAPELHLLATSREALRTQGEHVHVLEPLEGPPDLAAKASELLKYPAVQLFMERAAAGGYREPLDDATASLVAGMCHHLDGIALAIELVASRLGTHGVQGVAELLEDRFRLLWQGRRNGLPRHKTLHAMLDWSFSLLSERERTIFARLGVFGGPFDLAAARAVAGGDGYDAFDVELSLDHLVEKSLVWTLGSPASSLYRLPHVTRDFALVELDKRDDKNAVAARHARNVLSLLEAGRAHEPLDELVAAPPLALRLFPCLRVALNWSFSAEGDRDLAIDLVVAAAPLWLRTGWLGECRHWSERALGGLADGDQGGVKELALQEALAASVMFTRGNDSLVAAAIERGLALAETLGETRRRLHLLAGRHIFLTRIGAFDEAVEVSRRSLEIAEDLGCSKAQVMAEWMLATAYHLVGRQRDAQRHCDRGFALASANALNINLFGYDHRVRTFIVLARGSWLQGRWDQGVAFAREAIQHAERGGSPVGLCIALIYTATVLLWNGSLDEAGKVIERLEDHADRHAFAPYQACGLALRGELMGALGQHEEAVERLNGALARLQHENHHILNARASRALADSLMHMGALERARSVIEGAIDRAARSGGKVELSELLRMQGEIRRRTGDANGAQVALLEAIALADEQGAISWRLKSGEALARLWVSLGRAGEAQAEAASLSVLLDECDAGESLAAARDRLLALGVSGTP